MSAVQEVSNVASGDGATPPVKSAKQLEKEAKKAEKLKKFQEKNEKKSAAPPAANKEKTEVSYSGIQHMI